MKINLSKTILQTCCKFSSNSYLQKYKACLYLNCLCIATVKLSSLLLLVNWHGLHVRISTLLRTILNLSFQSHSSQIRDLNLFTYILFNLDIDCNDVTKQKV